MSSNKKRAIKDPEQMDGDDSSDDDSDGENPEAYTGNEVRVTTSFFF